MVWSAVNCGIDEYVANILACLRIADLPHESEKRIKPSFNTDSHGHVRYLKKAGLIKETQVAAVG